MEDCIFCRIVNNSIDSFKIYEDNDYIAVLDIFPNIKGQTLVIPKKHLDSYAFDLNDNELAKFIIVIKKVAKILEKGLNVSRVNMVFEGTEINHLHAKLYPAIGLKDKSEQRIADQTIYFEEYNSYVTTLHGPRMENDKLKKVMEEIIKNNK
ncbi:MAG: HIT family protein [Candidatus Micrarchaeia archaeon]